MRVTIAYATHYGYSEPARAIVQLLRLTPSAHEGQQPLDWRIEPSVDGVLRAGGDPHGNIVHAFYCDGPIDEITLSVSGSVATEDRAGLVRGAPEPLPPALYLRATPLTRADTAIAAFARDSVGVATDPIARLHALMLAVSTHMTFEPGSTVVGTDASKAFALGRGVCQDFSHVFLAAARSLDIPARYVSGHLMREAAQPAAHAWAEAHVDRLGWVGFDPCAALCPTDAYVRVATALDYLGAAPVRGSRQGGGTETLTVEVTAWRAQEQTNTASQSQTQSQSSRPRR